MSAVSVFGFSALKHQNKMRFLVDNPNTENADNVGSFCSWIIGPETAKKCDLQLIIQIAKMPTMLTVKNAFRMS